MNAQEIKEYLHDNNKVEQLLTELGCQFVRWHSSGYWTCGNPAPADNKQAITVYAPNLNVINYTRELPSPSDIFTLIEYIKDINFFQAIKYVHELFGLDLYKEKNDCLPESLKLTQKYLAMKSGRQFEDDSDVPIKPIPEIILSYYQPYVNDFWLKDHVPYDVQQEWELGYDESSNRITIPIRDEVGQLVGVKSRLFKENLDDGDLKYVYMEPCPRHKILYGLYKTYPYIKEKGAAYIFEAEKAIHQMWSYGYRNCVATGGEKVSKTQIEKLSRLAVDIVFCFDKDVSKEKIEHIAEQFINGISVYAIYDEGNLLSEKESPSDDPIKWEQLVANNVYKIK